MMFKHLQSLLLIGLVGLALSGCAGQFVRRPPTVSYDPANGVHVTAPTIGQVAGDVIKSTQGPVVYWHTERGDYELAPEAFDLEYDRLTNGHYRTGITLSIVPNGIPRAITVVPIGHAERIAGPTQRSGWRWTTKNHYDGAWRNYRLTLFYAATADALEFNYAVRSSPNRHVTSP